MPAWSPLFLDQDLLGVPSAQEPGTYGATLEGHGRYSTFQFVLRLSPAIHEAIARLPDGIVSSGEIDFAGAQAHSTYLHETIHWWQHIGSTYGLMMSLARPAGLQANYKHLRQMVDQVGLQKPIRTFAYNTTEPSALGNVAGLANTIINNQADFDAFLRLTYSKDSRIDVLSDGMFEGVGHAFSITWGNIALVIAATCDPAFEMVQHPRDWEPFFQFLRSDDAAGPEFASSLFHRTAQIPVYPVGAFEIMEGQARFGQLQYLHFASGGHLDWDAFRAGKLLGAPYVDAFEAFLVMSKLERPETIDHPTVGLFLLICDLALNPGEGFPFPLKFPAAFVPDVDPTARFDLFCRLVAQVCPQAATIIRTYSRREYEEASNMLAEAAAVAPPLAVAREFASWPVRSQPMAQLMDEYRTFAYGPMNFPIRVLFSHFLAFMQDKAQRPEVFCWPGAAMAGTRVSPEIADLFDRHGALFVDKADDDGVFPRLRRDRVEAATEATFNTFYGAVVAYDVVRQWIVEDGPFRYDYAWLSQTRSAGELKAFADARFMDAFGVHPDTAELLRRNPD
jgi:hypothetical protein